MFHRIKNLFVGMQRVSIQLLLLIKIPKNINILVIMLIIWMCGVIIILIKVTFIINLQNSNMRMLN